MPKSTPKAKVSADERRLQKGHVVVTKFLSYLNTTSSEGLLVLKTVENDTPALLTITSGESWVKDALALIERQPRIAANLRARDCVVVERRDFRKEKRPTNTKTPWFAKLPIEGLFEDVCATIEGRQVPEPERILRESVAAYFKTDAQESLAIQKLKDYFEFEPVPASVYSEFPPLRPLRQ